MASVGVNGSSVVLHEIQFHFDPPPAQELSKELIQFIRTITVPCQMPSVRDIRRLNVSAPCNEEFNFKSFTTTIINARECGSKLLCYVFKNLYLLKKCPPMSFHHGVCSIFCASKSLLLCTCRWTGSTSLCFHACATVKKTAKLWLL